MNEITKVNNGINETKGKKVWVGLIVLAIAAAGIAIAMSNDKTSDAQDSYGNGSYVSQNYVTDQTNQEEVEEIITPIRKQHSVQGNFYSVFTSKQGLKDNYGNVYDSAYEAYVGSLSSAKRLTYSLTGNYSRLRGTIYLSDEYKDDINYFKVYVYDENRNCIWESKEINEKNLGPINVDCNISGVSQITIEMEGVSNHCLGVKVIMPEEGFVFVEQV